MEWWVDRFGQKSGPYSDDQISRMVSLRQLTKLHRISSDRRHWIRVSDSTFWQPVSSAPMPIEVLDFPKAPHPVAPVEDCSAEPEETDAIVSPCEVIESPKRFPSLMWRSLLSSKKAVAFALLSVLIVLGGFIGVGPFTDRSRGEAGEEQGGCLKEEEPVKPVADVSFRRIKDRVALIETKEGAGTGFLAKMDGSVYLVSNEHVIRSSEVPRAFLVDGSELRLGDLSVAEDRDLARYEVKDAKAWFEIDEDVPNNGDKIAVYGNSRGDSVITTLKGTVTGVGREWLKVDAEIVGGNSGSPIVGENGKVIGVAALLRAGSDGQDWTVKDTQFDKVRRLGIRFTNVKWTKISQRDFCADCRRLEIVSAYWDFLVPYLICMDVSAERRQELKLTHRDIDRKVFGTADEGFQEMLMSLSKAYWAQTENWESWHNLLDDRDALIEALDKAVAAGELAQKNAERAMTEYDAKKQTDQRWKRVKECYRDFNAKRKESLLMLRAFLTSKPWVNPRVEHGYDKCRDRSVDWYLEGVQYFLDQNAQKLKDINKILKAIEKGDEDEEA